MRFDFYKLLPDDYEGVEPERYDQFLFTRDMEFRPCCGDSFRIGDEHFRVVDMDIVISGWDIHLVVILSSEFLLGASWCRIKLESLGRRAMILNQRH
jgi:hypothetical protein